MNAPLVPAALAPATASHDRQIVRETAERVLRSDEMGGQRTRERGGVSCGKNPARRKSAHGPMRLVPRHDDALSATKMTGDSPRNASRLALHRVQRGRRESGRQILEKENHVR